MEQSELIALLQQPSKITEGQTAALKRVLEEYPYFQAGHALLLKGLKNQGSLRYNKELKKTAAHTLDRAVLFDYISSEEFNQNKIADRIKQRSGSSDKDVSVVNQEPSEALNLNEALRMKLKESERVFDPQLFAPSLPKKDYHEEATPADDEASPKERTTESAGVFKNPKFDQEVQGEPEKTAEETPTDLATDLEIGKPLSFQADESHSFSEWLRLTRAKPIERDKEAVTTKKSQARKFKLIDQFISRNPRITPTKTTAKANLAETEPSGPEALMTETLARVYLEQKNYKKAIQAYKILILKNPEKSGFFADQIRAIKKLQEHNS